MIRDGGAPAVRVAVWDLPIRVFHWLIVLLLPLLWWTAEEGLIGWHRRAGYAMLGLILFRIFWGAIGGSTARFAQFVRGPAAMAQYLRGRSPRRVGHSPVGALSVLAMLGVLALQIGLGLFAADEDGLEAGPLAHHVSFDTAERIAELHEALFNVILAMAALHIIAILYYLVVRRDNLVKPMVVGTRSMPAGTRPMVAAPAWRFVLAAALSLGLTLWIANGL